MSHQNSIQKFHRNLGLELLCKQSLSLIKKASFALTVNTFNFFTHKKVSLQTDCNKAAIVLSSPLRLLQNSTIANDFRMIDPKRDMEVLCPSPKERKLYFEVKERYRTKKT